MKVALTVIIFSIIALLIYNVLKVYLLSKIKVNKWVIFTVAILVFFLPVIFGSFINLNIIVPIQATLFVILFLWFFDLSSMSPKKKEKKIKIKPKAKPNRVKNNNVNNDDNNKKGKKR